jgi:hypothetical protein
MRWSTDQQTVLSRHAAALRSAGQKAWNVYCVFLSEAESPEAQYKLDQIEEDFSLARKIARCGIRTPDDVARALLSLLRVRTHPVLGDSMFDDRLRTHLQEVRSEAIEGLLGTMAPEEIARVLGERQ